MSGRTRYEANVCVLLRRSGRWLLTVRAADVTYAPGMIGLVGGHVEPVVGAGVFEATARREALEETGLDLSGRAAALPVQRALPGRGGPAGADGHLRRRAARRSPSRRLADPDELAAVGWWTLDELPAADNCPPWLPPLLVAAAELLDGLSRR